MEVLSNLIRSAIYIKYIKNSISISIRVVY